MARPEDWPERLGAYIESRLAMPFEWGVNDYCSFPLGAVAAVLGAEIEIPWTTEQGAESAIEEAGGIEAALSSVLGAPQQNWRMMSRGDVGLVEDDGNQVGVVCVGDKVIGPGDERLETRPISAVRVFWRIG